MHVIFLETLLSVLTFFVNHKAAYIPVCIAGSTTSMLTSEPAVAISTDLDEDEDDLQLTTRSGSSQRGVFFRRVGAHRNLTSSRYP